MKLLDVSLTFFCRTTYKNEDGKCPIVLRINFNGDRRDVFTGLYCFREDWNRANRVIASDKKATAINQNLEVIHRKAHQAFDSLRFSDEDFFIDDIVDKIKGRNPKPTLLIDFLKDGILKMKKKIGTEILQVTHEKYQRGLTYMLEFLQAEYKVKNFSLQKVNKDFLENYFHHLRTEKKISHNTACKYLGFVKTIFLPAIKSGIIKTDPFFELKVKLKLVHREFLSQEEIDKIVDVKLNDKDLDRKRDIFLFACYTGLAYIDLQQLNTSNFVRNNDGSLYIRKPRQKTGQESIIPILPAAERILLKYSITGRIEDFIWYISSNQKMNEGLKHIGKKAGIAKALHMHLARHTFATTVTLGNGVPIETVSKMLGHASISQTQHYAKVIPLKIKLDMEKIRDLYK